MEHSKSTFKSIVMNIIGILLHAMRIFLKWKMVLPLVLNRVFFVGYCHSSKECVGSYLLPLQRILHTTSLHSRKLRPVIPVILYSADFSLMLLLSAQA